MRRLGVGFWRHWIEIECEQIAVGVEDEITALNIYTRKITFMANIPSIVL